MYGLPYGGTDGYPIFKLRTDTIGDAYGMDRVGIAPEPYCMFKLIGAGDETRDGVGSEGSGGIRYGSSGMTGSFSHSSSSEEESSAAPALTLALVDDTRWRGGVR